ncbi:hypothetical protein C6496_03945 [Candidatus Poribacteria bacterium]|nr:MAG: hypothetical protein C6496_03945 [Candidatus Poribacteria bacterium]
MHLPQGPVTYKYIEVGKTLYQAVSTRTPRFPPRVAYVMLNSLFEEEREPITVYDPFCGNGVILCTAYLLFWRKIKKIIGADLHPVVLETAQQNFRWMKEQNALEKRLHAIQTYKTENNELKRSYQERCRLIFNHAQQIHLDVELLQHDATRIQEHLALIDGEVAIVTDPPYAHNDHWQPKDGPESADFGPLEPFLQQVAEAPNVATLLICYRVDQPIRRLLEMYFVVTPLGGTKGRAIYRCEPRYS